MLSSHLPGFTETLERGNPNGLKQMGLQVIMSGDDSQTCPLAKLSDLALRGSFKLKELEKAPAPALPMEAVAEPSVNTSN
ncbi:hypothetical protein TNCV_4280461 [Trichonephila clavipes]|nr:hypothetical protein TNCV_4280461 [Trichonephila clavipes]